MLWNKYNQKDLSFEVEFFIYFPILIKNVILNLIAMGG
ncbi:putative membrane protein (plasmid) [Bacillus cereus E33L]|nr:putative membrane protein [Bacillus cereus E33L]